MEVGFLNWFELDTSNRPPWQAVPSPPRCQLLPARPQPFLSQAGFTHTRRPSSRGPRTQPHGLERSTDLHPKHSARIRRIGASCPLWTSPACLLVCCFLGASPFSLVLDPFRCGNWWGGGPGWSGEGEIVISAQTEKH